MYLLIQSFASGSVVKNPPGNAGDVALISGSGRSLGGGNGNPLQYSYLEKSHGHWSLAGPQSMALQRVGYDWVCTSTVYISTLAPLHPPRVVQTTHVKGACPLSLIRDMLYGSNCSFWIDGHACVWINSVQSLKPHFCRHKEANSFGNLQGGVAISFPLGSFVSEESYISLCCQAGIPQTCMPLILKTHTYTHTTSSTMQYDSAIKKNEIRPFSAKRMNL